MVNRSSYLSYIILCILILKSPLTICKNRLLLGFSFHNFTRFYMKEDSKQITELSEKVTHLERMLVVLLKRIDKLEGRNVSKNMDAWLSDLRQDADRLK
jgi:hypothetical protein